MKFSKFSFFICFSIITSSAMAEVITNMQCKSFGRYNSTAKMWTVTCSHAASGFTCEKSIRGGVGDKNFAESMALGECIQTAKQSNVNLSSGSPANSQIKPVENKPVSLPSVSLSPTEKIQNPSKDEDIKFKAFQELMSFCKQENPNASEEECGKFAFAHYEELLEKKGYKKSESTDCPELKEGDLHGENVNNTGRGQNDKSFHKAIEGIKNALEGSTPVGNR